ncbi:MAG: hypothetical protein OP8BY_0226 [Candidatus Saccharicenans subterraneus]|uniref:Uncharacterized protein n=1 Tax=Candidatus Saccharicenans subterraneus TaxID=2508984 RepID=A0A3E2BLG9_9BACT|nr:MAG: hypothetical protein OP8BY_0226 [Candidatus Saccharicenans subterraneum]
MTGFLKAAMLIPSQFLILMKPLTIRYNLLKASFTVKKKLLR